MFPHFDVIRARVTTPCVVVDEKRMMRNITGMIGRCESLGIHLRPHAKTHKSVEIARRQVAAGAVGIAVATLSEAEVFAEGGIADVFVAYPVIASGARGDRLAALNRRCTLSVGVESAAAVPALADAAQRSGRPLRVLVELDSGEHRTGTQSAVEAVHVGRAARSHGLDVVGVFTHGGHSYDGAGAAHPAAEDEIRVLDAAAEALRHDGHDIRVLSGGSTPTAAWARAGGLTELRAGTFVFGDRQQCALDAIEEDQVALAVLATVVSTAVPGQVVLDAGAKVLSKDLPASVDGYGVLPAYPAARVRKLYDHHAIVELGGPDSPAVGDVVSVIPNHVCPVVNLATELAVVRDDAVEYWPVDARARNS